jgi:hypothetical protein
MSEISAMDVQVVELRQYRLHPGQRDVLIELFDREFLESQEAEGMAILGQFRDLDEPDRFVWLRGFPDMERRRHSLASFYSGQTWRAHAAQANATMIDSDDVLLLRPRHGFPRGAPRPPVGHAATPTTRILATIYTRATPFDDAVLDVFEREVRSALAERGVEALAWLQTEPAVNTFPALPVRDAEFAFVWFARFDDAAGLIEYLRHADDAPITAMLGTSPQYLRLAPTARSRLR